MLIIWYILLMLNNECHTDDQSMKTKTVSVGDNVTLTCPRVGIGSLYWIRLGSGKFPEVLGKTFDIERAYSHIRFSKKENTYDLHITKAKQDDTGVYYCLKTHLTKPKLIFLDGTNLTVADTPAVPTSAPACPRNSSVTLQFPVILDSEKTTCPEERTVSCSACGLNQTESGFIYGKGTCFDDCEKTLERLPKRRCVCSFTMNITSSDIGMYHCSVGPCEETSHVNGSSPDSEAVDSHQDKILIISMGAAFILILIVIAVLFYSTNKRRKMLCDFPDDAAAAAQQSNPATDSGEQQSLQTAEYSVVYAATTFNSKKSVKRGVKKTESGEEESIYSEVKTLDVN